MNNTNWDGTVNKTMFDLSQVGTNYETFNILTKRYLINCLVGNADLTGKGSLIDYFDEIVEEVIERGEIALVEIARDKHLAIPKRLSQSLLKEPVKGENNEIIQPKVEYEFTLLDNSNLKYHSQDISKYVIFKLNKEGTSHLSGLSFWTKRLTNILKQMEKETFMNEKGIMVTVPSWPDSSDISLIMKSFSKKPFFFMCLPKSQKGDAKTGTTGIPPHSIKTEIYEPKEFHEEKYRNQFDFNWTNMKMAYGIRHDVLAVKEERASVTEVFTSQASFDAQERKIFKYLWKAIKEYDSLFDNGKGNYQFKYGRAGVESPMKS